MTIENYDEILTCTDCILRVGTPRGVLCVTGEGFCLDELASGALSLSGCVRRIEYEENT